MTTYPPLQKDKAFWGITLTQFLGAFNDNVFKMLLLLICTDYVREQAANANNPYFDPYQTSASLLFAFAFVLFTGFAGYLSDRNHKKDVVVLSKVAEIVVMMIGLLVFLLVKPGGFSFIIILFGVLFLMGLQSAFFGPSKYGILPEMFSDTDLPAVNGVILATTFLAIIFGTALAGLLKSKLSDDLWIISLLCVALAIVGTGTATMLRRGPPAQSDLEFSLKSWFVEPGIWKQVVADRLLLKVLLLYSVFWFVGGVVALTITLVGQIQLELSETITAAFNASMGVGIGSGSLSAAAISKKDIRFWLVRFGGIGMFCGLAAATLVAVTPISETTRLWGFGLSLFTTGFFGGWVAVPLQVFIQARPAPEQKGRVIALMNLMTWIGILCASLYYFGALAITGFQLDPSWILLSVGVIMLVPGVFLNLKTDDHLKEEREESSEATPVH